MPAILTIFGRKIKSLQRVWTQKWIILPISHIWPFVIMSSRMTRHKWSGGIFWNFYYSSKITEWFTSIGWWLVLRLLAENDGSSKGVVCGTTYINNKLLKSHPTKAFYENKTITRFEHFNFFKWTTNITLYLLYLIHTNIILFKIPRVSLKFILQMNFATWIREGTYIQTYGRTFETLSIEHEISDECEK